MENHLQLLKWKTFIPRFIPHLPSINFPIHLFIVKGKSF